MRPFALALLAATALCGTARADIAVSANDAHTVLDAAANQVAAANAPPDTVSIIDLSATPPRVTATVDAPASVVGPPFAVAVAPDESFAIVTGATKAQPGAPFGIAPDDAVSVIDLQATPPRVVQTLHAGAGATTVRFVPGGAPGNTLAIVANRTEGTLSLFTVKDKRLTDAGKVAIGPTAMPGGLVVLPDGKRALVSRYGDHQLSVLRIDGTNVTVDKRPLTTALAPYTMDMTPDGQWAVVSNMGRGDGDIDSVSLVDLRTEPFRTVQTLDVGRSPEGLRVSPDGRFVAVAAQNGTTKVPDSPFFRPQGRMIMLALEDGHLRPVAEAPIGRWSQGFAFSRDGRTVLVQNMVERTIQCFGWDGKTLTPGATLSFNTGPAAIMTAW